MKTTISATALFFASASSLSIADEQNSLEQCFPDNIPWYTYNGDDYIFSREKYNSICVDSHGKQYQWGKIEGVYPPIDEPDGGCSATCVSGYGRGQARGCTSMKPDKLVGFNYNCNENACYCLYEKNTWSDADSPCFDSMDTGNHGQGDVYNTQVEQGSTCYSLYVQQASTSPTPPGPPPGSSICTYSPDYDCYQTGHPACCSENDGEDCPSFLTMCDNNGGRRGASYCTYSPDYSCYESGRPECCSQPGGDIKNCPKEQPSCDIDPAPGSSICTYSPDYDCYKSGHPACCSENGNLDFDCVFNCNMLGECWLTCAFLLQPTSDGETCPSFLTMCDNNGGRRGASYCTYSPDYDCYESGWPECCSQPGGDIMNCPKDQPSCDIESKDAIAEDAVATFKYLRAHK